MKNYNKKIVDKHGTVGYYNSKGQIHRLDGPAVEWTNGDKAWFINGKQHRENGPAIEYADTIVWCLFGKKYSRLKHNRLVLFVALEPRRIILAPQISE